MRLIETGVKDGKSCVVKETEIVHDEGDDISIVHLLDLAPARLPPRPEGKGEFVDIPVAPGEARWYRVRFPASQLRRVHHTDTVDCHTIVAGSIELLLDDGAHLLGAGDSAIVTGVDHGWKVGPKGCVVSMIVFGTPKP
jgi:hypothetical protein